MIQSGNGHAKRANVNKASDVNVCHMNDSYNKVKGMPERKLCQKGAQSHFYDLKNPATKKHNSQQCRDKEIKRDEHVKATQG